MWIDGLPAQLVYLGLTDGFRSPLHRMAVPGVRRLKTEQKGIGGGCSAIRNGAALSMHALESAVQIQVLILLEWNCGRVNLGGMLCAECAYVVA